MTVLRERHGDRVNFIHVDLYENPEEIRTMGLGVAIETPLLREWGLHTPEWTFIIGAERPGGRALRGVRAGSGARGGADRGAGRRVVASTPPILDP